MKRSWLFFAFLVAGILFVLFRGQITDRIGVFEVSGTVAEVDTYEVSEHVSMIEDQHVVLYEFVLADGTHGTGTDRAILELSIGEEVSIECLRDRGRVPLVDPGWYRCTDAYVLR
ncbi:MAG TPA: hypothetical protein QGF58_16645 [Myxococcota bacterium]|nr:hypothetical protein [Myxococcota bacterium]